MEGLPPRNIATAEKATPIDQSQSQGNHPNGNHQWRELMCLLVLLLVATLLSGLLPSTWEWLARVAILLALLSEFRPLFVPRIVSPSQKRQPSAPSSPARKHHQRNWGLSECFAVFLVTVLTITNIVLLLLG